MRNNCHKFFFIFIFLSGSINAFATSKNGFNLDGALIPVEEIHFGGPPKDGIPSLDNPKFVPAQQARFLQANDRVLALKRNGIVKAYPLRILNWHEIVNDRFGDENIVIVYCPLCGSGTASKAQIAVSSYNLACLGCCITVTC